MSPKKLFFTLGSVIPKDVFFRLEVVLIRIRRVVLGPTPHALGTFLYVPFSGIAHAGSARLRVGGTVRYRYFSGLLRIFPSFSAARKGSGKNHSRYHKSAEQPKAIPSNLIIFSVSSHG